MNKSLGESLGELLIIGIMVSIVLIVFFVPSKKIRKIVNLFTKEHIVECSTVVEIFKEGCSEDACYVKLANGSVGKIYTPIFKGQEVFRGGSIIRWRVIPRQPHKLKCKE